MFDVKTFEKSPEEFVVVCTDVDTGLPVYHRIDHVDYDELEWIRASASMPIVSRIVTVGGRRLLDGGVADSIPLREAERRGYDRSIVVLTQPNGYRKKTLAVMPLARLWLRKHHNFLRAMAERHVMYNSQLDYVGRREAEGTAIVVRPDKPLPIAHLSHSAADMQSVYTIGRNKGEELCERLTAEWG